jgi:plastocyanin
MSRYSLLTLALALVGCTNTSPGVDGGTPATDTGTPGTDAPAEVDGGGVVAVHECGGSDFVDLTASAPDDRMIMVPRGTFTFDNPCITISAGQAVMFMWDFAMHPLQPGVAPGHPGTGTEPSPIVARTTGALYEVTFPAAGDYPFYCGTHYHSGMYGVVRVTR